MDHGKIHIQYLLPIMIPINAVQHMQRLASEIFVACSPLLTWSALHGDSAGNDIEAAIQQTCATYTSYRASSNEHLGRCGHSADERAELKNDEKGEVCPLRSV